MRRMLISAALLSAAVAAGPAIAQYGDYGPRHGYGQGYRHDGQGIRSQLDQIVHRIRRAEDRDRISRREEKRLLSQADRIERLYRHYRRNGVSAGEYRDLQHRIDNLRRNFHWERSDDRADRWDGRRGWND